MAPEEMEKQLHCDRVYYPSSKLRDIAIQQIPLKHSSLLKSRIYRPFWLTCLSLVLFILTLTFGVALVTSTKLIKLPNFACGEILDLERIIKTSGSSVLYFPFTNSDKKRLRARYHDDSVFAEEFKPSHLKAGRHSMETIKRATSNLTGVAEELPTAPINTPSIVTTMVPILPVSSHATSGTLETSIPHATNQMTSLSLDSSATTLSSAVNTLTSKLSSTISSETAAASPTITTPISGSSDNDVPTSTKKGSNSPSLVRTVSTRETIYTTTLPNGAISTSTSTTIIEVETEESSPTGATRTKTPAGLQTNIALRVNSTPIRSKVIGVISIMGAVLW